MTSICCWCFCIEQDFLSHSKMWYKATYKMQSTWRSHFVLCIAKREYKRYFNTNIAALHFATETWNSPSKADSSQHQHWYMPAFPRKIKLGYMSSTLFKGTQNNTQLSSNHSCICRTNLLGTAQQLCFVSAYKCSWRKSISE